MHLARSRLVVLPDKCQRLTAESSVTWEQNAKAGACPKTHVAQNPHS
jgi:hypothetical protein